MKCPECVQEGRKSKVYPGVTSVTAMSWGRYYDENGLLHSHDPNRHSVNYSCSNGHKWGESKLVKCPSCTYGSE